MGTTFDRAVPKFRSATRRAPASSPDSSRARPACSTTRCRGSSKSIRPDAAGGAEVGRAYMSPCMASTSTPRHRRGHRAIMFDEFSPEAGSDGSAAEVIRDGVHRSGPPTSRGATAAPENGFRGRADRRRRGGLPADDGERDRRAVPPQGRDFQAAPDWWVPPAFFDRYEPAADPEALDSASRDGTHHPRRRPIFRRPADGRADRPIPGSPPT